MLRIVSSYVDSLNILRILIFFKKNSQFQAFERYYTDILWIFDFANCDSTCDRYVHAFFFISYFFHVAVFDV
jgi:hypothetical protein